MTDIVVPLKAKTNFYQTIDGQGIKNRGIIPKTLSNDEARDWYKNEVDKIKTDLPPTEENAKKVSQQRAELKREARKLMENEKGAKKLDNDYPVQDFDYYKKKYGTGENKLEGKELYEKILGTSKTTNKEVDTRYGSGKNK